MTLSDIKALPVVQMAAHDSLLLRWTIRTHVKQALGVIAAWNYVYKPIAFTWVKTTKDGKAFPMGMSYYTRGNPELCLLAARGKGVQRLRRDVRELIIAPRRQHSQGRRRPTTASSGCGRARTSRSLPAIAGPG